MVNSLEHMPINDEDIIDITPKRLSTSERLFLPNIFKGLGTTMRHAFQNVGRDGKNKNTIWVVQYPEEKRDDRPVVDGGQYREHFRGVHRLNKDEDNRVRCVACFMCATACPSPASTASATAAMGTNTCRSPKLPHDEHRSWAIAVRLPSLLPFANAPSASLSV